MFSPFFMYLFTLISNLFGVKGEAFDNALEVVDVVRHKPKGRINVAIICQKPKKMTERSVAKITLTFSFAQAASLPILSLARQDH